MAKGVNSQRGKTIDFGLTTTPQLQYYVYYYNEVIKPKNIDQKACDFDIEEIRRKYWENFSDYFVQAAEYIGWDQESKIVKHRAIDCANGVGGHSMPEFIKRLDKHFKIDLFNGSDL